MLTRSILHKRQLDIPSTECLRSLSTWRSYFNSLFTLELNIQSLRRISPGPLTSSLVSESHFRSQEIFLSDRDFKRSWNRRSLYVSFTPTYSFVGLFGVPSCTDGLYERTETRHFFFSESYECQFECSGVPFRDTGLDIIQEGLST